MLSHFLCVVDGDEFLHVCEGPVACSDSVAIEKRPEGVARGITFVQGGKHSLYSQTNFTLQSAEISTNMC